MRRNNKKILIDIDRYLLAIARDITCLKSKTSNINKYPLVSTSINSLFLLFFLLFNLNIVNAATDGLGNEVFPSSKVGVGTTGPSVELHVVGSARITGLNCSGNANGGAITADANGNLSCSDDNDSSSLWTDGGATTYLTSQTDDLAVGETSLTAPFSVDESANTVRIGEAANSNGTLSMYALDGTGSVIYTTSDAFEFTGGSLSTEINVPEVKFDITNGGTAGDNGVEIDATSAGDAFLRFEISHNPIWTIGLDNCDGADCTVNKFKIGQAAVDSNTALTINSNRNVGIGTTDPSQKLTVQAANATSILALSGASNQYTDIDIGRTSSEAKFGIVGVAGVFLSGSTLGDVAFLNSSSTNKLFLSTGTTETVTVQSDNVGIGTSVPADVLHIVASDTNSNVLPALKLKRFDSDSVGAVSLATGIDFYLEDSASNIQQAARFWYFWTDATDGSEDCTFVPFTEVAGALTANFSIISTGNVGINDYGDAQFEIVDFGQDIFMISDDASGDGNMFNVKTTGNVGIGDLGADANFEVGVTATRAGFMISNGEAGNGDFLSIDANGNIGLGDATPDARFEIVKSGANIIFMTSSAIDGNGDFMIMNASGNVGIGQTDPEREVELSLSTGGSMLINTSDTTTVADQLLGQIFFDSADGDESTVDASVAIKAFAAETTGTSDKGGYLQFWTKSANADQNAAATVRMHFKDDGNVGIGISTPIAILQVAGDEVRIGDAGVPATATGDGDLYVEGVLEVDGNCTGAALTCRGDVAEEFDAQDGVEAGDIVTLNDAKYKTVERSSKAYDYQTIGVVSTKPTIIMGSGSFRKNPVPIALSGVVPVKVNLENGPIKIGDYITNSSAPGVGMKATKLGKVVGIALQEFNGNSMNKSGTSKIDLFVDVHWRGDEDQGFDKTLAQGLNQQQKEIDSEQQVNKAQDKKLKDLDLRLQRIEKLSLR